jgi:hypothetical protein
MRKSKFSESGGVRSLGIEHGLDLLPHESLGDVTPITSPSRRLENSLKPSCIPESTFFPSRVIF